MTTPFEIRLLETHVVAAYVAHLRIHDAESGTHGDLPYGPYSRHKLQETDEATERTLKRIQTPIDEPGWRRIWCLWFEERVVGSVHLAGSDLEAGLHRVDLGIGIERPFRGKGQGRLLMMNAIAWAKEKQQIAFIDLGVFEGNDGAHALYRELGFAETGRKKDLYRVDGVSVNDIQMSLDLNEIRRRERV